MTRGKRCESLARPGHWSMPNRSRLGGGLSTATPANRCAVLNRDAKRLGQLAVGISGQAPAADLKNVVVVKACPLAEAGIGAVRQHEVVGGNTSSVATACMDDVRMRDRASHSGKHDAPDLVGTAGVRVPRWAAARH